ncbi:MAG TPA: MFS transporter [Candidatus Dormibacteraeota bacterium]|nr:MFS transporter [Candidatus Dormibacteraeota bacterium]
MIGRRVGDAAGRYVRLAGMRPYNVLVAAEQLSAIGDAVSVLAVPIFVFGATNSALAAGAAVAARSLPWVFIGPAVAVWTDRYSRQGIMVACDLGRAVLTAALFLVTPLPAIVVVVLGIGTMSAIQRSARASLIPSVVGRVDYPTAASLQRMLLVVGTAVGSAIGGVLIARIGARYGFLVDAGSFAASGALVLSVRVPAGAKRGGGGGGLLEGWRQVFAHRQVAFTLWTCTLGFVLSSGGTLLATRAQAVVFHADASLTGNLIAVVSVGVAVGSIAMGSSTWLRDRYPPAAGPLVFALAYATMTLVPRPQLMFLTWTLAGLVMGAHLVYLNVIVVQGLPNSVLGRATSVINAVGYSALVIGPYLTGALLDRLGPRYAPLGLALVGAAAVPAAALASRAVARRLGVESPGRGGEGDAPREAERSHTEAAQAVEVPSGNPVKRR